GEDTRKTFAAQLHKALCNENIVTFIDDNLRKGKDVGISLEKAIKSSRISIVVFSETYATSKWCLQELAQIMQCRRYKNQVVIPVFYEVDPSDVRKQKGSYETAFARYKMEADTSEKFMETVDGWKAALTEAANISGWDSRIYG
ncbi:TMV resistance protein N-like, partial [Trifolium medium]|nr:TMV resistance protein N-like [Trifolium medium]